MDDSSKRRPAPRQVYVPVHRRKEMEKKENAATPSSLKQLESKPNEDAPVKRKGRGQFKAPSSSDYSQKDSNDMAKINSHVASENKQAEDTKVDETEKKEEAYDENVDELASKLLELNLSSKDKHNEKVESDKGQNAQGLKPSSKLAPGRDPRRPATTDMVARRLIHGALGIRLVKTPEQRQAEKDLLQAAREKRQAEREAAKNITATDPFNE
ncbi:hypothetical protein G6F37_012205 [Rhizopus arrhizus]|nr:hypothetical protein G6F38_012233 [Rhizopus arrhizus]KAG1145050.1 hypothetical protein G6F37_012205 [Rhizopus arrhizus]